MKSWEPVIGIEIHAQVLTQSKMFSPDSADFNSRENHCVHPVSLGFPGTLPVLNKKVVELAVKTGQAFHCSIQEKSVFARKHYFYPDLPKGYQISQSSKPLLMDGYVEFYHQDQPQKIHLEHIHIEEDAGRLIHQRGHSYIDFNRAGQPLLEIISRPELSSPAQAADYARMVRMILCSLNVCDGNLQEGSMRFDCNISLRPKGSQPLGTKVELKNLNSFRFMEKSLNFEIKRQSILLNSGKKVVQETRLFNPKKGETFSMRAKEMASDYRYFPEPDLPILKVQIPKAELDVELPFDKIGRWLHQYKISLSEACILIEDVELSSYFDTAAQSTKHFRTLCKWMVNEVLARLNEQKLSIKDSPVKPSALAELVNQIENKTLSSKMGKDIFSKMWETQKNPQTLIKEMGFKKLDSEEDLLALAEKVLQSFPDQCCQYREGKASVYKFLMGQMMKLSKGQADPVKAGEMLKKKLDA